MKWREIDEAEVKTTISNPEKVVDSIRGRKNAFRHIGEKLLKVTYTQDENRIIIITAIDKNK